MTFLCHVEDRQFAMRQILLYDKLKIYNLKINRVFVVIFDLFYRGKS
jgi:hypothetical protein